jgi:hypothetical protein
MPACGSASGSIGTSLWQGVDQAVVLRGKGSTAMEGTKEWDNPYIGIGIGSLHMRYMPPIGRRLMMPVPTKPLLLRQST